MSDNENSSDTPVEQAAAATPTIRNQVRDRISNLGDRTREQVIEHFAQKEADRQAQAMISGLDKLDSLERDLTKIRPAPSGFDSNGNPVGEAMFSKQQVEDRAKLNKQIDKLTKAINKADDNNDFGDLFNLTKGS